MALSIGLNIDTEYKKLNEKLFSLQAPELFPEPELLLYNDQLAKNLGLDVPIESNRKDFALLFSGQQLPEGVEPLAQAYAGHQFGHFNRLGDGRALLLGEHITPSGLRYDIQFKGSGPTVYSRRGDGFATLYAMLREYLISEAMAGLGIPTTRSLAVVATGLPVQREQLHAGAVLTRVAQSHIRVGSFQYVRQYLSDEDLKHYLDYVIQRHYPESALAPAPAVDFLRRVTERQAALIAQWMSVGFIHGVMNTDNMSIPGETIDYGPCAFMDVYDPNTVFSSIDHQGRYAYRNQPAIAQWNLGCLAGALLPLIHPTEDVAIALAKEVLYSFDTLYATAWNRCMSAKLGLEPTDASLDIVNELLHHLEQLQLDFSSVFFYLTYSPEQLSTGLEPWLKKYRDYCKSVDTAESIQRKMQAHNPVFIPRNYWVEKALTSAAFENDYRLFSTLLSLYQQPFKKREEYLEYSTIPDTPSNAYVTYCGT